VISTQIPPPSARTLSVDPVLLDAVAASALEAAVVFPPNTELVIRWRVYRNNVLDTNASVRVMYASRSVATNRIWLGEVQCQPDRQKDRDSCVRIFGVPNSTIEVHIPHGENYSFRHFSGDILRRADANELPLNTEVVLLTAEWAVGGLTRFWPPVSAQETGSLIISAEVKPANAETRRRIIIEGSVQEATHLDE
jgi:hypothetical protein